MEGSGGPAAGAKGAGRRSACREFPCFCLLPAGWGGQRCSGLRHHPGGRDIFKDWQLCLKMQKLRLFGSRNPEAFARGTLALAAGAWADGVSLAAAQSWLRRVGPHLHAGPASHGPRLRRADEHEERGCRDTGEHPEAAGGGGVWPPACGTAGRAFDLHVPAALTVTLAVKFVTKLQKDGLS